MKRVLFPLALVVLIFGIYAYSLGNDFVTWDDGSLVYRNPIVRELSFSSIAKVFTSYDPELYNPLTRFSYQVEYKLFGLNPFYYHLDSLLLHIANVLLVFWLFILLLKRKWLAFFLALIWGVHPLNTEVVAWISARKDVLSAFFFLSALISYCLYLKKEKRNLLWLSLALFLLALLSKVLAVTLPLVLLLIDYKEGKGVTKESMKEKMPFFALSAIFGIVALFGKAGTLETVSLWSSFLLFCKSTVFLLQKFLSPTGLSVVYPYTESITLFSFNFLIPLLIVLSLVGLTWYSRKWMRQFFFGFSFFFITLLPTLGGFAKGESIHFSSDRFVYLPMIGLLFVTGFFVYRLLAAWPPAFAEGHWHKPVGECRKIYSFLSALLRRVPPSGAAKHAVVPRVLDRGAPRIKPAMVAIAVLITCAFGAVAHARSLVWRNSETLYKDVIRKYPNAASIQYNLGLVYDDRGEQDRAVPYYKEAIRLRPGYSDAYNNLGAIYLDQGLIDEAIDELKRAIEINPDHVKAHGNLGVSYGRKGMYLEGLKELQKSMELDPDQAELAEELQNLLRAIQG